MLHILYFFWDGLGTAAAAPTEAIGIQFAVPKRSAEFAVERNAEFEVS